MNTKYLYLGLLPLMATSGMAATDSPEAETRKNERPNILFILSDDHTSQAWGIYGGILAEYAQNRNIRRLAEETGLTPEEIASVDLATGAPESLQQETAEGLTLESTLGTDSPEDRMVEHIALREAIDQLPEREKMTILLRFFKGLTQEQTARILGVSQVQISRLERRGLADLRRLLDG